MPLSGEDEMEKGKLNVMINRVLKHLYIPNNSVKVSFWIYILIHQFLLSFLLYILIMIFYNLYTEAECVSIKILAFVFKMSQSKL